VSAAGNVADAEDAGDAGDADGAGDAGDAGDLVAGLVRLGRSAAGGQHNADGEPVVLADRPDGLVVRIGEVVVKAHAVDSDPAALAARVRVAADPLLRTVLLPPLRAGLVGTTRGRPVTAWPAGEPVNAEDPHAAPWVEAGTLLARLHAIAPIVAWPPGSLPPAGGPRQVARAVAQMHEIDGAAPAASAAPMAEVARAFASLPAWVREHREHGEVLVHGDWHLGQLVWRQSPPEGGPGGWRLIDVDDLGLGDPVWDLARSAAWYAVGLLQSEDWWRFLTAYRRAGGPAVPPDADPWLALDVPARALTVQMAARGLVAARRENRPLDDIEWELVDACRRISLWPPLDRFEGAAR
jgi:Phosphotransferase enzyme family